MRILLSTKEKDLVESMIHLFNHELCKEELSLAKGYDYLRVDQYADGIEIAINPVLIEKTCLTFIPNASRIGKVVKRVVSFISANISFLNIFEDVSEVGLVMEQMISSLTFRTPNTRVLTDLNKEEIIFVQFGDNMKIKTFIPEHVSNSLLIEIINELKEIRIDKPSLKNTEIYENLCTSIELLEGHMRDRILDTCEINSFNFENFQGPRMK